MAKLEIRNLEEQLEQVEAQLVQANGRSEFGTADVVVKWDVPELRRRRRELRRAIYKIRGGMRPIGSVRGRARPIRGRDLY